MWNRKYTDKILQNSYKKGEILGNFFSNYSNSNDVFGSKI